MRKWQQAPVSIIMMSFVLCFPSKAKTEHKAEMEVPTTTKVKVADFFQRLVCGLLISFRSHCCSFFFIHAGCLNPQMTGNWLPGFLLRANFPVIFEYNQPCLLGASGTPGWFLPCLQSPLEFHPSKTNSNHRALLIPANDSGEWKGPKGLRRCAEGRSGRFRAAAITAPCETLRQIPTLGFVEDAQILLVPHGGEKKVK